MIRIEEFQGEMYGSTLNVTKNAPWGSRDVPRLRLTVTNEDAEQASIYLDAEAELRLLKFLLER